MTRDGTERPGPDGYELHRIVGRSPSSVVWEATQKSTGRRVALKILNVDIADEEGTRRFDRERHVMGMLSGHPHIVTIYDAGIHAGRPWLAMEFCAQGSLAATIDNTGPLSVIDAIDVLVKIGSALTVAHQRGVLHCDVKPANILISDFGEPALGDFGIARLTIGASTRTATTGYSLDHAPPELLNNERPGAAADIYSLGTTVWELVCGYPPFRGSRGSPAVSVIRRILLEPLPEPTAQSLPTGLVALLAHMTAKEPSNRPASMGEVVDVARNLQLRLGSQQRRLGSQQRQPGSPRNHPVPAATTAPNSPADKTKTGQHKQADHRSHRSHHAQPGSEASVTGSSTRGKPAEPFPDDKDLAHTQVRTGGRKITQWLPDSDDTSDSIPQRNRRRLIIWAAAALAIVLVSFAVILAIGNYNERRGIVLQAVTEAGRNPFTPDFSVGQGDLPEFALSSSRPAGQTTLNDVPGDTEGLYQGTKGGQSCDRNGMFAYLAERPPLATAWANALNIDPTLRWEGGSSLFRGALRQYFAGLTPVFLRADTRVTDHGYHDGQAEQYQSILQAGTAVLVDAAGVPRARCASGNPLTQVRNVGSPRYTGEHWPGFNPATLATVTPAAQAIHQFGLIDVATSTPFRRPAGSTGDQDIDQIPEQADIEGIYKLSGPRTACVGFNCAELTTESLSWQIIECAADKCSLHPLSGGWDGPVDLVREGATWRATGPTSTLAAHPCGPTSTGTNFAISFTVATAEVVDSLWLSERLDGTYEETSPTGECSVSYNISGSRQ